MAKADKTVAALEVASVVEALEAREAVTTMTTSEAVDSQETSSLITIAEVVATGKSLSTTMVVVRISIKVVTNPVMAAA